jgi:uncharacterized protein
MRCVMVVLLAVLVSHASGGQLPSALTQDPPADKAYPAAMQSFQIPSHDGKLDALMYITAGSGPHPTVVLLHGFPGNEKNLDLAQAIRRDGWNVLWFNNRGSWGSPGDFHSLMPLRTPKRLSRTSAIPSTQPCSASILLFLSLADTAWVE